MQKYKYITLLFVVLFLVGCAKDDVVTIGNLRGEKAVYGFGVGGATTRTFINDDGVTISWSNDDKVALWAKPATGGDYVLSNQTFNTWFVTADNSQAFFTAELDNAMPTNTTYQYYVTYPTPSSVNGTMCTYTLPAMQDGMMGGGADIMVGEGEGPALAKLYNSEATPAPDYVMDDGVKLHMKHLIHALRFYVPAGKWGFDNGETIERIVFTMPDNVAGTVTTDVSAESPALSSPANTTNTISLNLKEPIGASTANAEGVINYDYACASILPGTYNGDMTVKVYSQTKVAQVTIPINSRTMSAGHITPVGLNCTDVVNRPKISFRIASNNLGEKPYKITLTSSDTSTQWKAGDDHVYEYYTGSESSTIAVGGGFDLYTDEEVLSSISGKSVTVTYESKSAIVTETITIKTENVGGDNPVKLNVPYLFSENFDTLTGYDGDYKGGPYTTVDAATTAARDLSQYGLSSGWSGARTGCDAAGTAILVSARRDKVALGATNAYGRLESPAMSSIKDGKKVNVKVSFKYSGKREGNSKFKSTAVCGYTTDEGLLNGYATQFNDNLSFNGIYGYSTLPTLPTNGSVSNTTSDMTYTINGCASDYRLSWHIVHLESSYVFINNGYGILYIDNIKVQIVSE